MAKYCGSQFLLQIEDPQNPDTYLDVALCVSNSLAGASELIDVTDKGSSHAREVLANCGTQSWTVSGEGQYNDSIELGLVEAAFRDQTLPNFRVVSGRGDSYTGAFKCTAFERGGAHNEAESFTFTLESSGALAYVAGPPPAP